MDLDKFIENALLDIARGVRNVQEHDTHGGSIAPSKIGGHEFPENSGVSTRALITSTAVQFDVAVTVNKLASVSGGGKGNISVASASAEISGERSSSSVTRLKFSVPFVFKPNKNSWSE